MYLCLFNLYSIARVGPAESKKLSCMIRETRLGNGEKGEMADGRGSYSNTELLRSSQAALNQPDRESMEDMAR